MLKINLTCKLNRISDTLMDLDKLYLILRFDLRVKPIFLIPHLIPEILIDSKVVKIDPKSVFSLIFRRLSQFIWYTLYLCTMVFYGLFCNIFFCVCCFSTLLLNWKTNSFHSICEFIATVNILDSFSVKNVKSWNIEKNWEKKMKDLKK